MAIPNAETMATSMTADPVAVADAAHRGDDSRILQALAERERRVLAAMVGVMDQAGVVRRSPAGNGQLHCAATTPRPEGQEPRAAVAGGQWPAPLCCHHTAARGPGATCGGRRRAMASSTAAST